MNEPAKTYRDLRAWQESHQLVLAVYRATGMFPDHERFGLVSQRRRAAVSVAANIAEGFAKRSIQDKLRYFNISQGSLTELHYYLVLVEDLGYGATTDLRAKHREVAALLGGYMRSLRNTSR